MSTTIRVRSLPTKYSEEELLRLCACFGEVVDYSAVGEGGGASAAAAADVTYEEREDALAAAANMEGMEFNGAFLRVFVKQQ
ncbi:hypothetical protein ABB37_00005 [Leptomonas pyrrhocoris]|uniref:RRM domain-containing protein n=1 Tax=Leptomonas pyrrhocoris TaxID=157538 RepID=A0A0M9G9J1_LEPPY|nr:hypothetical protein ABB37_00005 [Leptomonas pyrrhocoris]KPA85593.1 hypothetical protein ABB37_00005 [Leptomonas pyrrhocoris]|eukprot:XP_015664032.1 hypothetical protein ABB37_00005 [Leptomonas pyrrhocoris]